MSRVHLRHVNSAFVKIETEASTLMELAQHFTRKAENYKFHPKYKARIWDGNICMINRLTGVCLAGLAQRIKKFCDENGYEFTFDEELTYDNISEHELLEFIKTLNIPEKFSQRDYQIKSVLKCIRSKRRTLISPTSSGKSLMIYLIARWYGLKTLIIVPTIGLVNQMASDFEDYGYDKKIHKSTDGLNRGEVEEDFTLTTWQSLDNGKRKLDTKWLQQFDVVIGDEAHGAKATTLKKILESMTTTKYRFGTTGTLDDIALNTLTIEGLFGPQYKAISTKEMIDKGYASKIHIKVIVLRYPEEICKQNRNLKYPEEIDFLINYEPRNNFIKNLALSLKGNKLVFFKRREHGNSIHELLKDKSNTFFIDGTVEADEREEIRKALEEEQNAILVASIGTTATGISVKRLHHMIAASPSKGKIKVLQSIGRMLRLHKEKEETGAVLYDIVDDMSIGRHENYTLKHFKIRSNTYDKEEFEFTIYNVRLK